MAEPQPSLISQLLLSLGITREDLEKHSDQMRQFLTTEDVNSLHAAESNIALKNVSSADTRSISKPVITTSSFMRSRSRASSYTLRDGSLPPTPMKTEPVENAAPLRHFDSMEMVIERQRRQNKRERRERRERERDSQAKISVTHAPSPSPGNASQSGLDLDSFMRSRVDTHTSPKETQEAHASTSSQVEKSSAPPVTPQRSKYYRDHTNLGSHIHPQPRNEQTSTKAESPTPTRTRPPAQSLPIPPPQYFTYPQYLAYARAVPPFAFPSLVSTSLPVTPQHQRTHLLQKSGSSPLPPSSPPASSPVSTPHRPVVNLVSSPGPMGPLPDETEYDNLPYTLPPGPYSPNKPDLSYAALVGQAILSSPEHRLTLQEIYDWITIVYPHFKRGETTWMNSIRHVLSTTVVFRKVPRDRSIGRTLWAIWDEDLECFKGGGFRKQLCKDIVNNTGRRDSGSKGKGKTRKRAEVDVDPESTIRKVKRVKKDHPAPLPAAPVASTSYMPATMTSYPLFPPTRPTAHHQPYYESCLQPQTLPADIIFPPLPAGVAYSRIISSAASSSSLTSSDTKPQSQTIHQVDPPNSSQSDEPSIPGSTIPPSNLPGLSRSSSSPPATSSDMGATSSVAEELNIDDYIIIGGEDESEDAAQAEDTFESFTNTLLSPVKHWGRSPSAGKGKASENSTQLGTKLEFGGALSSSDEDDEPLPLPSKSVRSSSARKINRKISFPPMPASPTLNRKALSRPSKVSKASPPIHRKPSASGERPTTPTPSTPPRNTRQLPISSLRTPLSSKGINPAALHDDEADHDDFDKTPRKRSGAPVPTPVTPRRLTFPANQNDSPFRTPGTGAIFSPFRTPGSHSVLDPHDPAALLEEELNHMGASSGDSPAGLFGGRGSLLYHSPEFSTSPGHYARWW
ncbi:hypothetical protein H0H81_004350 [Sphagnurus paluster]|uniref:Fork-head domain-containing protein n=1 Tax=Sphagnurus paluster TaxID=117069 RepID=A0A9P7KMI4_9AGAR|nr:hypothetical protein H0H81_004350 [Sphagnurus paluster]